MKSSSLASICLQVTDPQLSELLGGGKFFSITYRLFKVPGRLETSCEDYGQAAKYLVSRRATLQAVRRSLG